MFVQSLRTIAIRRRTFHRQNDHDHEVLFTVDYSAEFFSCNNCMAQPAASNSNNSNPSPVTFAIQNLWQKKEDYTMNLILFEDDEIECEMDDIPLSSKQNDDNTISDKQLRHILLKKDDYRCKHIETVLKSKSGDSVRIGIVNGKQGLAKVLWNKDIIQQSQAQNDDNNDSDSDPFNLKKSKQNKENSWYLKLEIIESTMQEIIDPISDSITLILALPRPKVLNRLYPIISSLGIKEIVLINAKRVEKCYFNSKYLEENRYTKGLMAGMVQCRDTKLPNLTIERDLENFIENKLPIMYPKDESVRIVAHPGEHLPRIGELPCFKDTDKEIDDEKDAENDGDDNDKLENEMSLDEQTHQKLMDGQEMKENVNVNKRRNKQFVILIGAEGGWIDDEIAMLEKNDFNVCSLGMRILRTDVACVSLLSILRSHIEQYLHLR